jgi:uncharacterized protein YutE (UPF0331/DUF86 family)
LRRLEKALQILRQSGNVTFGELTGNEVLLSAVERNFQVAIECVLDVGNHLIAEEGFETPDDNEAIIEVLGKEGVLSTDLAARMRGMAGFRNILVHEYTGIDYVLLYDYLVNHLDEFREFAVCVVAFLDRGA